MTPSRPFQQIGDAVASTQNYICYFLFLSTSLPAASHQFLWYISGGLDENFAVLYGGIYLQDAADDVSNSVFWTQNYLIGKYYFQFYIHKFSI